MAKKALNGPDQWSDVVYKLPSQGYSISIDGTLSNGLVVQRGRTTNGPWYTYYTFVATGEYDGDFGGPNFMRVGYPLGATVAGTVNVDVY